MSLYGACKGDQLKNIGGLKIRIIRYSSMKVSGSKTYEAIFFRVVQRDVLYNTYALNNNYQFIIKKIKYDYGH